MGNGRGKGEKVITESIKCDVELIRRRGERLGGDWMGLERRSWRGVRRLNKLFVGLSLCWMESRCMDGRDSF
jgi:hypothetical protein